MQYVISGVACIGKTHVLRYWMKFNKNVKVQWNGYREDVEEEPRYKSDRILYMAKLMDRLDGEEYQVCMRGPEDELVYRMVSEVINKQKTMDEGLHDLENQLECLKKTVKKRHPNRQGLVLIWYGKIEDVVESMQKRNNGIDILTEEYVRVQNEMFKLMARRMRWRLVGIKGIMDVFSHVEDFLAAMSSSFKWTMVDGENGGGIRPMKMREGSAGYDLYAANFVQILPKEWKDIRLKIEIELPRGMVGFLKNKSSNRKNGFKIFEGIIDWDDRDELNITVKNVTDQMLSIAKGEKIAQIVILPCYQKTCQFVFKLGEVGE